MCRRHPIVRVNIAVLAAIAAFSILLVREVQAQEPNALGLPCNTTSDAIAPDRKVAIPIDAALLTGRIPCAEAVNPAGPLGDDQLRNLQRGFDFYSWLTFIALNAPASGTGIANSQPGTKAKWEDTQNFIQLLEVMRRDRKEPEWNREDRTALIPQACRSDYTKGMMVVEMIEESYNQPFRTGPLIDQRGRFAIFDILMNKEMFDYIMKHGLHRQSTQKKFADRVDFPAGDSNTLGSFMLKVSWKVMDAEDDPRKFHTTDAIVILPRREDEAGEPACMKATLGLIGFHAVHKTIGRLQWIWTSFEHVDNVPEQIEVDAGPARLKKSYNFFDPSCDRRKCPVNETPPRPWAPNNSLRHHTPFQSQITRVVPLTEDTKDINAKFQALLGNTVWKNYMLIGTQWPSDFRCARGRVDPNAPPPKPGTPPGTDFEKEPDMNCVPAPAFLANATLETFSQGEIPQASSNCIGCHGNATTFRGSTSSKVRAFNQSDFTFILEKAVP